MSTTYAADDRVCVCGYVRLYLGASVLSEPPPLTGTSASQNSFLAASCAVLTRHSSDFNPPISQDVPGALLRDRFAHAETP